MLVTDHSRSMQRDGRRAEPARRRARTRPTSFLDQVPKGVRVGAVAFNQRARGAAVADDRPRRGARRARRAQGRGRHRDRRGPLPRRWRPPSSPALPGQKPPPAAIVLLDRRQGLQRPRRPRGRAGGQEGRHPRAHGRARHASPARCPAAARRRPTPRRCARSPRSPAGTFRTAADADQLRAVYERARLARCTKRTSSAR